MMSIRFRLFFFMSIMASVTGALAYLSFRSFNELREQRLQLDLSYLLREDTLNLNDLKPRSEAFSRVVALRGKVTPQRRADELSNLIQAINEGNPRLLRERHSVWLKNESEFQRVVRKRLDFNERQILYFGSLALLTLTIGFLFMQIFIHRLVIHPLQDLSRKMFDFLNDRYTYQFSVPSSDEIGQMQSTFNSLAQRVISNMEQLKTLDQAKSEFLSIASHELRTPLTSIKGSLSLMRSGVVGAMNDMAGNLLTIAENETDRLIRLINDILDLAKIEAGKLPLHQDWTSWNELVKTCCESLQGLAGQANVRLLAEPLPPMLAYIDSDRVQQVLTNLLSNAIKFSPKGASVIVACEITDKQTLRVEVRDQGRGIAPEDQEAIFQKFRQATNSKNPLVKGTGLGLAIARALVEQHGGEIGLHSTPGLGSTFYFTIPEWKYSVKKPQELAA